LSNNKLWTRTNDNYDIYFNLEIGGTLEFHGAYLYMNSTVCSSNTGFRGGAIYFNRFYHKSQMVLVENCFFASNFASNGGVFGFDQFLEI